MELVLKNGLVADGARTKPYTADICIQNGVIAQITPNFAGPSQETLDIGGMVVSPGFIDIHTHSDLAALVPYEVESKLRQGVTLEIGGNCGISAVPGNKERPGAAGDYFSRTLEQPMGGLELGDYSMREYAALVSQKGCGINYGMLIGHGTLRLAVTGFENRVPTTDELDKLKSILDKELADGAFGMSLGLIYPPSSYSKKEELVELAKVVKKHGAVLTVHLRNEGMQVFEALDEMLEIAGESGAHLHVSHLKLMTAPQWGRGQELLDKLKKARLDGIEVSCDQYPFNASATSMLALVPGWAQEGGAGELLRRLKEREGSIAADIEQAVKNRGGASCVLVSGTHGLRKEYEGKNLQEISESLALPPADAVIKVLLDCDAKVACVYFCMSDDDVNTIMRDMDVAIGSDGYSLSYDPAITDFVPHPRNYGTFPHYLRHSIDEKIMPLEDIVYKITGLPAKILKLKNRGILKAGNVADITVFDPQKVENKSTYMESRVHPVGIPHVIVKGCFALRDGSVTGVKNGGVVLSG